MIILITTAFLIYRRKLCAKQELPSTPVSTLTIKPGALPTAIITQEQSSSTRILRQSVSYTTTLPQQSSPQLRIIQQQSPDGQVHAPQLMSPDQQFRNPPPNLIIPDEEI